MDDKGSSLGSEKRPDRKRYIVRKGLDLDADLGPDLVVAKLFPCEGAYLNEIKMPLKMPLNPETGPECVRRSNYVANSTMYHYPRPLYDAAMSCSSLESVSGTTEVTPIKLLEAFLKSNQIDISTREPEISDWLALVKAAEGSYPMMFLTNVLRETPEAIAQDFHTLWNYLKGEGNGRYFVGSGLILIPDYMGDRFTIKEGLILQLVGDQMGILVLRESEEEQYSSDEE